MTKFPEGAAFDLNQNIQRGKKAYDVMFTLTTGCSHVWLVKPARYLTGTEELLMHSIPISKEAADIMKATQVVMKGQSHSSQCFMAGNSMHGANVGTCIAYALLFTRSTWWIPIHENRIEQSFLTALTPSECSISALGKPKGKKTRCSLAG